MSNSINIKGRRKVNNSQGEEMGSGGGVKGYILLLVPVLPVQLRLQLLLSVVLTLVLPLQTVVVVVESKCQRVPIIFNFGDSNSDTGGLQAGLGYVRGLPYGRLLPGGPSGRVCDGRLIIDFLCESVNARYLNPYLLALESDFQNGVNFAVSGSSTQPTNVPFSLLIQVLQFLRFRSRSLDLIAQGSKNLINEVGFRNALYTFDIGQNDLSGAFNANQSYPQVIERIPSILAQIKRAIKIIYDQGGKNFWVHNTGPLGCLPQVLSMFKKDSSDVDASGCLTSFNNAAKAFNDGLSAVCDELSTELENSTIVYTDLYAIKYNLIADHSKYGFENPLTRCCIASATPCNYSVTVTCSPPCQACTEGSRYINWDGVHYTEAANAIAASKILSTDYSYPRIKFENFFIA